MRKSYEVRVMDGFKSLCIPETGAILCSEDPTLGVAWVSRITVLPDLWSGEDIMEEVMESVAWEVMMDDLRQYA